ncbi:hypothetical protein [Bergeriella denitrificans]|uniref:Lipoprotein n=1 Tax=Bergeriella denitrificans TaxID=494 RepID=A0A378UE07_BERDE|nr:hypothetical protein [Bergeriella denitrificans]STZ75644.1 Uncharacterised protein [Bergeriella denitrificans]
MTHTKILFPLLAAALLAACSANTVAPHRWHQTGMSETDVVRQQRTCKAQAYQDAKQGKTPQSLEECMDRAGYYQIQSGRGNL